MHLAFFLEHWHLHKWVSGTCPRHFTLSLILHRNSQSRYLPLRKRTRVLWEFTWLAQGHSANSKWWPDPDPPPSNPAVSPLNKMSLCLYPPNPFRTFPWTFLSHNSEITHWKVSGNLGALRTAVRSHWLTIHHGASADPLLPPTPFFSKAESRWLSYFDHNENTVCHWSTKYLCIS